MGKRSITTTKDYLINAALPQFKESYTVIEHGFVINKTLELLASKGFAVRNELYRCNENAQIAQGVYHLDYGNDPDMGMMFAWSNSYDKSMRFKCAIGGYVFICMNGVVSGNMGSWGRKHTGTADEDTQEQMTQQIDSADIYFNQLVQDKASMQTVNLSVQNRAELMGRLFFEHKLVTLEQLSIVRQEVQKPSYQYTGGPDTLWALYNHITHALKSSHPRLWMDQQRMVHWFITDTFGIQTTPNMTVAIPTPQVVSNQITIEQVIAEVEGTDGSA